jgi:hypothetical protein
VESLPKVWGAAQLPEVGSEVSASTAIPGHKSHKEGFPATEDQLSMVPIEVHLCQKGDTDQALRLQAQFPSPHPGSPGPSLQQLQQGLLPGQCHH